MEKLCGQVQAKDANPKETVPRLKLETDYLGRYFPSYDVFP
ncbi:hypothetical protein AAKU52_003074 [Pedobacter sp. CG_S7]